MCKNQIQFFGIGADGIFPLQVFINLIYIIHEISEVNPQKDFNIIDEALKKIMGKKYSEYRDLIFRW